MFKKPFLIFDILFLFFAFIVYSISLSLPIYLVTRYWDSSKLLISVALVVFSYFLFLNLFIITLGLLKRVLQPKLSVGEFPIGPNLKYLGWVLNSLFQGIMIASPFASQCHFIFYLNWLYYRLMGMKLPLTTLVGMNATIRQPELIEVGENSILGLGCTISCHYSPSGKTHVQKRVKIGSRSVVGGFSIITPGVVIGDHSVVGTNSRIYPDVIIGNNVKIGAECSIKFGTIIPDNVKIKSNTIIEKDHQIKSGETWGGSPARLISEDGQKE